MRETVGNLLKAGVITLDDLRSMIDAYLSNPKVGLIEITRGRFVDIAAAVAADRHALATLKDVTARPSSKRAAVKSAILLAQIFDG